jgi:ketosteroid isomerase-like protein
MTQERTEWVRHFAEAWNRGDLEAGAALLEAHLAPEWEFASLYLDRVYGRSELRQMMADLIGIWRDYHSEIEEVVDLGEYALMVPHITGRGAGSGVPIDQRIFMLSRLHGEKVVWTKSFASRRDALEAAGMRE